MFDESIIVEELSNENLRKAAFEKVVKQYAPLLYRQIRRMVHEHEDANDVLQNSFLKAWNNISYFRGEAKLSTWLYRIAFNESLSFLERQSKLKTASLDDVDYPLSEMLHADVYFSGNRCQELLQEAISLLPEQQRVVFNLRYFDEMKYKEMSEIMGVTEGALKATYHHAVKKIEQYIRANH